MVILGAIMCINVLIVLTLFCWLCLFVCIVKGNLIITRKHPEFWEKRDRWIEQKLLKKDVSEDLEKISKLPLWGFVLDDQFKQDYPQLYKCCKEAYFFLILFLVSIGLLLVSVIFVIFKQILQIAV